MPEYASRHLLEGDRPLRREMRLLGWLLRRLVVQHGGESLWHALRDMRDLAEKRLAGDSDAEQAMADMIAGQTVDELAELTRVMGLFFDLANLAEDHHRVRVLREREREGTQSETIGRAAEILADMPQAERTALIQGLKIEPVLTGHPTEAKRRSSRRAIRRIRRDLYVLGRDDLLPGERRYQIARMQRDLSSLWYTDPVSPRKPTVLEELGRTLFAGRTMWRVTPKIMASLRAAFDEQGLVSNHPLSPLRFGLWIGGDRDGNPLVTTDVTCRTLQTLRKKAVRLHRGQCKQVRHRLTVSARRAGLPPALKARIDEARGKWPKIDSALDRHHPEEWLVQWAEVIDQRLAKSMRSPATLTSDANKPGLHPMAYRNAADLIADVDLLADALREAGHHELLTGALQRWRDRIDTFGLHLLRLDMRINSTDLTQVVDAVMRHLGICNDYASADEERRRVLLTQQLTDDAAMHVDPSALPDTVADLWAMIVKLHDIASLGGGDALGNLIISMTHRPSDMMAPVWLLRVAALGRGADAAPRIPVVPLFETIDDLQRAEAMLRDALDQPLYRDHVRACDDALVCMVGYSDSAKDGGYLASNWALYQAQERMIDVANDYGVELTVFHGRGGALGRGGGPTARAIHSLPPEAVDGRLRLTEQGEVIAERYDDPAIARRHLEQIMWATLTASHLHGPDVDERARALVRKLAANAEQAYRDLVGMPQFVDFLRNCTALPLVEKLRIGSRPSRRSGVATLADLRAIPFTFAWNQVRMPINAFYGLGASFAQLSEDERKQACELYQSWSWFRAVVDNATLALARCDAAIAHRYVELAADRPAAEALWQSLSDEFERSLDAVMILRGTAPAAPAPNLPDASSAARMLANTPWLNRTIRVRLPYLDMLNLMQVELMARQARAGNAPGDDDGDPQTDHALRGTVQALAAGLRNTG